MVGGLLGYFVSAWVSALSDLLALEKEQLTARVRSKSLSSVPVCLPDACLPDACLPDACLTAHLYTVPTYLPTLVSGSDSVVFFSVVVGALFLFISCTFLCVFFPYLC